MVARGGLNARAFTYQRPYVRVVCPSSTLAWALLGLGFGLPAVVWPARVARWGEVIDAVGRKPAGPVEPTDTNVYLTRAGGAVFAVFGLLAAVSCL